MNKLSLSSLIKTYRRENGPRLDDYLDYFRKLKSLDDAIRFACHGKERKIHPHQRRVGKETLEQARKVLQCYSDEIRSCKSFDELLTLVENHTSNMNRFGALAVYDTSLRIGAHVGLWPEVVYLHAGTKKGCTALGVGTKGGKVEMERLPMPIRELEPQHAENFLCIFKGRFAGLPGGRRRC